VLLRGGPFDKAVSFSGLKISRGGSISCTNWSTCSNSNNASAVFLLYSCYFGIELSQTLLASRIANSCANLTAASLSSFVFSSFFFREAILAQSSAAVGLISFSLSKTSTASVFSVNNDRFSNVSAIRFFLSYLACLLSKAAYRVSSGLTICS